MTPLECSHGFLSMIFGFLNKFWVYIEKIGKKIFHEQIEKNREQKTKPYFLDFFQIQNADTLIRSYHIKHDFQLKFIDFPVIFKDNLETLFLAEACLSFPECSEQFWGSLET